MGELLLDGLRAIRAHKLRSVLTLSGIVFGVAAVVSMFSIVAGIKSLVIEDFDKMGMKEAFSFDRSDASGDSAWQRASRGLVLADAPALDALEGVVLATPVFTQEQIGQGPLAPRRFPVYGIGPHYLHQRRLALVAGRGITALDVDQFSRVAVLGERGAKELFGERHPVGLEFRLDGERYRVVGLVRAIRFQLIGGDWSFLERRVYVPVTTLLTRRNPEREISFVQVSARSYEDVGATLRDAEAALLRRHRGVRDFEIDNFAAEYGENLALVDRIMGGWNIVLGAIAIISLLVGGTGLFGIMQIAVRERVREIGIKKAVGADDEEIRREFLAESLTLAAAGGVLGIALGAGVVLIAELLAVQFGRVWEIPISVPGAVVGLLFSLIVGFGFGLYPASRAAQLDPIEAIRE
ncbi:MAG: ABC transporter permease [Gemmatimonadota bacterium]